MGESLRGTLGAEPSKLRSTIKSPAGSGEGTETEKRLGPERQGQKELDPNLEQGNKEISANIAKAGEEGGEEGIKKYIEKVLEGKDPSVTPLQKEAMYKFLAKNVIETTQKNILAETEKVLQIIQMEEADLAQKLALVEKSLASLDNINDGLRRAHSQLDYQFSPQLFQSYINRSLSGLVDSLPSSARLYELSSGRAAGGAVKNHLAMLYAGNSRMQQLSSPKAEFFDDSKTELKSLFKDSELSEISKKLFESTSPGAGTAERVEANDKSAKILEQINSQDLVPGYANISSNISNILENYSRIPDISEDDLTLDGKIIRDIGQDTADARYIKSPSEYRDFYDKQSRRTRKLLENFSDLRKILNAKNSSLQDLRLLSLDLSKTNV